jgi:glycosyltransferase involved in cell wall biosynthesis
VTPGAAGQVRVALATDWFLPRLGGIELHLADLARALQTRGCTVRVVTTTPGASRVDGLDIDRLQVARFPGAGFAVSPLLVRKLRASFVEGRFDVVHAHVSVVSPVGYAAVIAARSLGLPTVLTFHSVLLGATHVLRGVDRLLGWSRWPIVLSAVSRLVADQVSRAASGLDVAVLPNGIESSRWYRETAAPVQPRRDIAVVSAMRLHRKKRPLALLRAFRTARCAVAVQGRRLTLRIAGAGPKRPQLERYIARHGLGQDVALLGAQTREALAEIYAASDIFVLPSRRESFGLAALEARCAGLPVIVMRAGGTAEFLSDETALVAADDTALARDLARLALDDALRSCLARPDPTLARFSWPSVVDAHVACYARAAALAPIRTVTAAHGAVASRG